eukprot:1448248-Rhodomonas_salina.2
MLYGCTDVIPWKGGVERGGASVQPIWRCRPYGSRLAVNGVPGYPVPRVHRYRVPRVPQERAGTHNWARTSSTHKVYPKTTDITG